MDAFFVDLNYNQQQSAKASGYVNAADVRVDTGIVALDISKQREGSPEDIGRPLSLAEASFKATF